MSSTSNISIKKLAVSITAVPLKVMCLFSLWLLISYFLFFIFLPLEKKFSNFYSYGLRWDFPYIYFLKVAFIGTVVCCLSINFGTLLVIRIIASVPFYSSSSFGTSVPCVLDLFTVSHIYLSYIFHYFCFLYWRYFSVYFLLTYLPIHKSPLQMSIIICKSIYWALDFIDCIFLFLNFWSVVADRF